jgi:putative transposase
MVTILWEADEKSVPEVAKKHVSSQTIYGCRKHFGSLEPADIERLRQLEQENGHLKTILADRDLELDVLKEITPRAQVTLVSPAGESTINPKSGCAVWALPAAHPSPNYPAAIARRIVLDSSDFSCLKETVLCLAVTLYKLAVSPLRPRLNGRDSQDAARELTKRSRTIETGATGNQVTIVLLATPAISRRRSRPIS